MVDTLSSEQAHLPFKKLMNLNFPLAENAEKMAVFFEDVKNKHWETLHLLSYLSTERPESQLIADEANLLDKACSFYNIISKTQNLWRDTALNPQQINPVFAEKEWNAQFAECIIGYFWLAAHHDELNTILQKHSTTTSEKDELQKYLLVPEKNIEELITVFDANLEEPTKKPWYINLESLDNKFQLAIDNLITLKKKLDSALINKEQVIEKTRDILDESFPKNQPVYFSNIPATALKNPEKKKVQNRLLEFNIQSNNLANQVPKVLEFFKNLLEKDAEKDRLSTHFSNKEKSLTKQEIKVLIEAYKFFKIFDNNKNLWPEIKIDSSTTAQDIDAIFATLNKSITQKEFKLYVTSCFWLWQHYESLNSILEKQDLTPVEKGEIQRILIAPAQTVGRLSIFFKPEDFSAKNLWHANLVSVDAKFKSLLKGMNELISNLTDERFKEIHAKNIFDMIDSALRDPLTNLAKAIDNYDSNPILKKELNNLYTKILILNDQQIIEEVSNTVIDLLDNLTNPDNKNTLAKLGQIKQILSTKYLNFSPLEKLKISGVRGAITEIQFLTSAIKHMVEENEEELIPPPPPLVEDEEEELPPPPPPLAEEEEELPPPPPIDELPQALPEPVAVRPELIQKAFTSILDFINTSDDLDLLDNYSKISTVAQLESMFPPINADFNPLASFIPAIANAAKIRTENLKHTLINFLVGKKENKKSVVEDVLPQSNDVANHNPKPTENLAIQSAKETTPVTPVKKLITKQIPRKINKELESLSHKPLIHWFNPAFQTEAQENSAEMEKHFQELATQCDIIVIQLRENCDDLTIKLAHNQTDKFLTRELHRIQDDLKRYESLQLQLNGNPKENHPLLKQGILKTLSAVKVEKYDLRLLNFNCTYDDFSLEEIDSHLQSSSSSADIPEKFTTLNRANGNATTYELIPRVKEGKFREYFINPKQPTMGRFIEKRAPAKNPELNAVPDVEFTVSQFPDSNDSALKIKSRVEYSMALASQMLFTQNEPPTKKKPFVLEGVDKEELRYLWTALMMLGKHTPHMKFDHTAIVVASTAFDPARELGNVTRFSNNSCYETCFKNQPSLEKLISGIKKVSEDKLSHQKEHNEVKKSIVNITQFFKPRIEHSQKSRQVSSDSTDDTDGESDNESPHSH